MNKESKINFIVYSLSLLSFMSSIFFFSLENKDIGNIFLIIGLIILMFISIYNIISIALKSKNKKIRDN